MAKRFKKKQVNFLNRPSDIKTMDKIIYCGQKSYLCQLCHNFGPWIYRGEHKCPSND